MAHHKQVPGIYCRLKRHVERKAHIFTKFYLTFDTERLGRVMPVTIAASVLAAWLLGSWVQTPLRAWMFVFVLLCCVVLQVIIAIRKQKKENKEITK
jgi:uncharacterized membrane protein YfcA